jgi:hypothetical protein
MPLREDTLVQRVFVEKTNGATQKIEVICTFYDTTDIYTHTFSNRFSVRKKYIIYRTPFKPPQFYD